MYLPKILMKKSYSLGENGKIWCLDPITIHHVLSLFFPNTKKDKSLFWSLVLALVFYWPLTFKIFHYGLQSIIFVLKIFHYGP